MNIFFTIFLFIMGVLFLGWGFYQIKTGKMVAKTKGPTIDEPRQVGVLFSVLGVLLLLLSTEPLICDSSKTFKLDLIYVIGIIIFLIFIFYVAAYNFHTHRLFAIKKDKAINSLTKKYSTPFTIVLLADALLASALLLFNLLPIDKGSIENSAPFLITIVIFSAVSTIFIVYVNLKISLTYKKSLKKQSIKSKKK